jgi:hypothetical protein
MPSTMPATIATKEIRKIRPDVTTALLALDPIDHGQFSELGQLG